MQVNRELGTDKIDIWAEKGSETIAIEVRYKTAFLQTMNKGKHIHLKQQAAQDISRYDFVKDMEKLERIAAQNAGVTGYALLLTNDHLYWQHPKKGNAVDEDFHIYEKNILTGKRAWKQHASNGTTLGREEPIYLNGTYEMKWQPYLTLGTKRYEQFQALLIETSVSEVFFPIIAVNGTISIAVFFKNVARSINNPTALSAPNESGSAVVFFRISYRSHVSILQILIINPSEGPLCRRIFAP